MGRQPHLLLALLLLLATLWGPARAEPLALEARSGGQWAEGHLSVLMDMEGRLTMADIPGLDDMFQPLAGDARFGFSTAAVWLRLELLAPTKGDSEWWLEVPFPSLDDIRVYAPLQNGGWSEQRAGDHRAFNERPLPYRNFVFPLQLQGPGPHTLYIRAASGDSLVVPVRLWTPETFMLRLSEEDILLSLYYGIIVAMLVYNCFLWAALRDRIYGYYIFSTLTVLAVVAELNGHAFQYLWPDDLWLADNQHVLLPAAYFIAFAVWVRVFLNTRRNTPWLDQALGAVMLLSFGLAGLAVAGYYVLANQLVLVVGLVLIQLALAAALRCIALGYRPATIFLAAELSLMLGVAVAISRSLGLIPAGLGSEYALQAGSAIEVLLFSLALAQRVHLLRQEKAQAVARAETDPLTGLVNRAGLDQVLRQLFGDKRRTGQSLALLLLDLDDFKPVNDRYGHAVGDQLLMTVADRLRACIRTDDVAARLGGDEFVVLLPQVRTREDAAQVAAKMVAAVAEPVQINGITAKVSASIGIALYPEDSDDALTLFNRADAAMYEAKRLGRNRYHLYQRGL
ncbi:MAG TPA: diguanylate cyclase [Azospira sp.]|nr:diguanylate cyclase [Azospira sp.]